MKKWLKTLKYAGLLSLLLSLQLSAVFASEPFLLITEQEYQAQLPFENQNRDSVIRSRSFLAAKDKNEPQIIINTPTLTQGLQAPIAIDIEFKAFEGTQIDPSSLKVLYGWLSLDITDRIKQHAEITLSGLTANNVSLPTGEHTITIEISDSKKRMTQKEVTFEVIE